MPSQCIDRLGTLPRQKIAGLEYHRLTLLLGCLGRHKAHGWPGRCFSDGFGIIRIVLLPLHIGFDVLRGDEPDIVAKSGKLPAPVMRTRASLQSDGARLNLTEKL